MYIKDDYKHEIANIARNSLVLNYKLADVETIVENISPSLPHLRFVILIGGVGGSGKSSFINFCSKFHEDVYEESTIDCCKTLVRYMLDLESQSHGVFSHETILNMEDEKSDAYRTLLSDLKQAWCEFSDGPNKIVCNQVDRLYRDEDPFLIFVNVREPEQIDYLKKSLESLHNCIPVTLQVVRNDDNTWSNYSDRTTSNYDYDITIDNSNTLMNLEDVAAKFCNAVTHTNMQLSDLMKRVVRVSSTISSNMNTPKLSFE